MKSKSKKSIKNLLLNAICYYNGIILVLCLYGKFTDNYALMDAVIIASTLPIVAYTVYSVYRNITRWYKILRREYMRSRRRKYAYARPLREVA